MARVFNWDFKRRQAAKAEKEKIWDIVFLDLYFFLLLAMLQLFNALVFQVHLTPVAT